MNQEEMVDSSLSFIYNMSEDLPDKDKVGFYLTLIDSLYSKVEVINGIQGKE